MATESCQKHFLQISCIQYYEPTDIKGWLNLATLELVSYCGTISITKNGVCLNVDHNIWSRPLSKLCFHDA